MRVLLKVAKCEHEGVRNTCSQLIPIKRTHKISTVNLRHSGHLGTKSNYSGYTECYCSGNSRFQSSGNLPIDWPTTTTTTMKGQVFVFRYERVNSKRKFTIVAEIVFLLKKIYNRDIPLKAMFNVKTLTVLFSPYPREMKTTTAKLKFAAILTLTYFYGNCVTYSHARQNRTRVAYTCALI